MEALRCDAVLPRARVYPSLGTQTQRSIIGVGGNRLKNFFDKRPTVTFPAHTAFALMVLPRTALSHARLSRTHGSFAQSAPTQASSRCPYPLFLPGADAFMTNMTDMGSREVPFTSTAQRKPSSESFECSRRRVFLSKSPIFAHFYSQHDKYRCFGRLLFAPEWKTELTQTPSSRLKGAQRGAND